MGGFLEGLVVAILVGGSLFYLFWRSQAGKRKGKPSSCGCTGCGSRGGFGQDKLTGRPKRKPLN